MLNCVPILYYGAGFQPFHPQVIRIPGALPQADMARGLQPAANLIVGHPLTAGTAEVTRLGPGTLCKDLSLAVLADDEARSAATRVAPRVSAGWMSKSSAFEHRKWGAEPL